MTPPTPAGHWYDRAPRSIGFENTTEDMVDLGNGDWKCYHVLSATATTIQIERWSGNIYLVCVPQDGLSKARVFNIPIESQYTNPGYFDSLGDDSFPDDIFTCELNGRGLFINFVNVPNCAMAITAGSDFVCRILWGSGDTQIETVRALPLPYAGIYPINETYPEGGDTFLTVEDVVYLNMSVEAGDTFGVYGFNLVNERVSPKVVGGEASSGIPCDVVGGDYGVDVTVPDTGFENCWFLDLTWWLKVAEI